LTRETYNAFEGQRGRADQSVQTYRYRAPVCIVGESGFTEPAVLDRLIPVRFSKKDSAPHRQAFEEIRILPLRQLGRALLDFALQNSDEELTAMLDLELAMVDKKLVDRPRDNAAVARFGLGVLEHVLGTKFDRAPVDRTVIEAVMGESGMGRKSAVDAILEAMSVMSQNEEVVRESDDGKKHLSKRYMFSEHLEEGVHYQINKSHIRLYVAGAYPIFLKWAAAHSYDGDILPKESFMAQVRKESYFVEKKAAQIGVRVRNCIVLDLQVMEKRGLSNTEEWGFRF
jgi:hypothetical protein